MFSFPPSLSFAFSFLPLFLPSPFPSLFPLSLSMLQSRISPYLSLSSSSLLVFFFVFLSKSFADINTLTHRSTVSFPNRALENGCDGPPRPFLLSCDEIRTLPLLQFLGSGLYKAAYLTRVRNMSVVLRVATNRGGWERRESESLCEREGGWKREREIRSLCTENAEFFNFSSKKKK